MRDPADYHGEPVCPSCFDGWPCCAETKPDGTRWTHMETCRRYSTGKLCADCEARELAHA